MNEKYIELAKKLKALAEQGEGGEKYNAKRKLASLMKRYNITDEDISDDIKSEVKFRIRKEQIQLFFQVYISVTGWGRSLRRWQRPPYFLLGEVTALEELEIRAKFDFYWRAYQVSMNDFYQAFIHKNEIYPPNTGSSDKELTSEEMERIRRIAAMTQGIQMASYRKQLKK